MTRDQFTQTVRAEQGALRRYLLALCCGNEADALDLTQETLLRAYICLDQYDERGRAGLWLRRIATHLYLNHRHRQQRTATLPLDQALHIPSDVTPDATQALHLALATLSDTERTAIVLHYIEGYRVAEVARITGSTESAVKKQLQRAREELKRKIQL